MQAIKSFRRNAKLKIFVKSTNNIISNFIKNCEQYYNKTLLDSCLNSTVNNLLHSDAQLSLNWGISATPTFYVNYNGTANILRSEWARFVNNSIVTDYETFKSDFCRLINNSMEACQ